MTAFEGYRPPGAPPEPESDRLEARAPGEVASSAPASDDLDDDELEAGPAPPLSAATSSAIPAYLKAQSRWLLWRIETKIDRKTGETRSTKVPISYHSGKPCDVTAPASWTDYDKVKAALARTPGAWDGVGFSLGVVEDLDEVCIGLDVDTCLDANGNLAEWALPFLTAMPSYSEVSPSGTGIKIIARIRLAELPEARRLLGLAEGDREQARTRIFGERTNGAHAPNAQLFLMTRYFATTGQWWPTTPQDVVLLTLKQVAEIAILFGPKPVTAKRRAGNRDDQDEDETAPDEAALRDKLGAAFLSNPQLKERWEGGTQGLNDTTRSGRDMSILAMLVTAGFTRAETHTALCWFEHGKVASEPMRYFEQMWSRTKAEPRPEPKPRRSPNNILALVTHINTTPTWDGTLRYNLLTETCEIRPPFPPQDGAGPMRALRDPQDILTATLYFQANGFPQAGKTVAWDALAAVAHEHSYHPVRDYLCGLRWDGTQRVGGLFADYFKAEKPTDAAEHDRHVAYLEHISTSFMVGAVARAMEPGCKHDHVPVIVGRTQGMLKSTAIRALCRDPAWFTDNIPPDTSDRDTKESLAGKWIIELAEIPHVRRDAERLKAFLSAPVDRYRAAYGRASQDHPRQSAFIGTSNNLEFVDVTGNRRFWPFVSAGLIDLDGIVRDRDQLWAEAIALYREGVHWWLPPNIEEIARERQEAFAETDVWDDIIAAWIEKRYRRPFTMEALFAKDDGITPYRETAATPKADEMRAGRCLNRLGWHRSRCTRDGKRAYWWLPTIKRVDPPGNQR